MPLSGSDIKYIRSVLNAKGLGYSPLLEELVDDVCCQVEIEVRGGIPFKKAVENVLAPVNPPQLTRVQNATIYSDNYNAIHMMRNTFKILYRNLKKYQNHTLINVIGLAIGFACFIAIGLYVRHELSYDSFFRNASQLYRVTMSSTVGGKTNHIPTSYPALGPGLQNQFAGVNKFARILNYKYSRLIPTFRADEKVFYEEHVIFADSTFFDLFDFDFLEGNSKTALSHPNSVVITEGMAAKYFGTMNALGKHLVINARQELEITGVLATLPSATHMQFDFVIPMAGIEYSGIFRDKSILDSWQADWFWTYFIIPDPASVAGVEAGMNQMANEKIPDYRAENDVRFFLQPLKDIHLHSAFDYNTDLGINGDMEHLYIFIAIAVLILLISSINFINISIAAAARRYKEIGVSKVLGALRSQLRLQFVFESTIIAVAALLIAFVLLKLMLPVFSGLLGVELSLSAATDGWIIAAAFLFAIAVGVLSGVYPAFYVSSFEPQRVLKGVWKPGQGGAEFRKVLIGVQIAISIFLIIGTMVIFRQLQYIQHKSLGFDQEQIIMLPVRGTEIQKKYHAFKSRLLQEGSISRVSSVSEPIGREVQFMSFNVEGQPTTRNVKILNVTYDFAGTMGLEVVDGRDFSRDHATDSASGFLINEAAARAFGWREPVGKFLDHSFRKNQQGRVIGVVKDFNFEPLQQQIDPIILFFGGPNWYVTVRIRPDHAREALETLEAHWKEFEAEKPFAFQFLDQAIQRVYDKEQRMSKVFAVFSVLSILTAMMGLFGLISFIIAHRIQEIGIRKVLGASATSILNLITKDYLMLVLISFVLSAPVTYWIMNQWLEGFAFRISWSLVYFILGLAIAALIVLATIASKVVQAARTNPATTLRSE